MLSDRLGVVADLYHGLAADYDWIFGDDTLAGGAAIDHPATARLLRRVGPGGDVLDAACGTGIDAAVLARRGFTVRAADGSEAMVEAAAARFRREGLAIPVQRCLGADLPAAIDERFDVVLCTGNALVHAAGRDAMVGALTGLRIAPMQIRRFRLNRASREDSAWLREVLDRESRAFGVHARVGDDGMLAIDWRRSAD